MKKSIRTIGILLIVIAIIFALVNMGMLHLNYFQLLANGTAELNNQSYSKNEIDRININMSAEVVEFTRSEDDKIHFTYINSDKFFYNIELNGRVAEVNLTDNIMWYDKFSLYMKIPIGISIPQDTNVEIYQGGKLLENIVLSNYEI